MAGTWMQQARVLPDEVAAEVEEMRDHALQVCFESIAHELAARGYPVSGDFSPDEAWALDKEFEMFVRRMALNNDRIAGLNEEV